MATEVRLPPIAADTHEGTLLRWTVEVGATVEKGDTIAEVETAKTIVELDAPQAGTLLAITAPEASEIKVGELLAWIGEPGETPPAGEVVGAAPVQAAANPGISVPDEPVRPRIRATPIVIRLALELAVDITTISGSGPNGRITRDDVERAAGRRGT